MDVIPYVSLTTPIGLALWESLGLPLSVSEFALGIPCRERGERASFIRGRRRTVADASRRDSQRRDDQEGMVEALRPEHGSKVRRPVSGADAVGHLGDPGERDGAGRHLPGQSIGEPPRFGLREPVGRFGVGVVVGEPAGE